MDRLASMGIVASVVPRDLPAPSISTSTIGPIIGVVDGSDAAPGEVGEFIKGSTTVNYAAGTSTQVTVTILNLPPGDWDVTSSAQFSTLIEGAFFELNPLPVGVSNKMIGFLTLFAQTGAPSVDVESVVLIGQCARVSAAKATPLTFLINVDSGSANMAGQMAVLLEARRRR